MVKSGTHSSDGTLHQAAAGDESAGQRLDRFLAEAHSDISRSRLAQLITAGAVTRGGTTIKDPNHRVKPGETYTISLPAPQPAVPQAQDIPLKVVYEDGDLIVIDKPAGLVVHPAAGNPDGTLVNALIHHCGDSLTGVGGETRPGIVHRIDKDTSGLIVAAKNERAMASLAKQFANHTIERAYTAVVWGAPRLPEGKIATQIGRNPFDRKRMGVLRGGGKEARTNYKVIERFGDPARPFAALIECRLETGRTHQIRVHLTHLGHPLIGDPSYGHARQAPRAKTPEEERAYDAAAHFPRQALHAGILGFQHPSLHQTLRFTSDWPEDLSNLIAALRGLKKP
jgi:23S rRNA pseudouridine1911/1915/1917 synthase